jgi:hypothetical protein
LHETEQPDGGKAGADGYDLFVVVDRASRLTRCGTRTRARGIAVAATVSVVVAALVPVDGSSGAQRSAVACSQAKPFITGAPSQSLLSILGVLRRPATSADGLPASIRKSLNMTFKVTGTEVFVNYVRRARVISGVPYYVWPVLHTGCGAFVGTRGLETMVIADGTGWGGAGDATTIKGGTTLGGGTASFGRSTIDGLVPDGVATATLHYPAGKVGGFDRKHAPAFTIMTHVVGNLLHVTIPRGGNRLVAPMTMTWRATTGRIIKTFNRL